MVFVQTMSVEDRFWSHVAKTDGDGCWEWKLKPLTNGYGRFSLRRGKGVRAHRMAWELENGLIPEDICVLHDCDNPICVRPDHLFLGTHADNIADRDRKGRGDFPRGERHGSAKLSVEDVKVIRSRRSAGATLKELADEYGVVFQTIWFAVTRKNWRHVQ